MSRACDAKYPLGLLLRINGEFRIDGAFADPTTVKFRFRKPNDTTTTIYVFGTDIELVRASLGQFYVDLDLDQEGKWQYWWESTGAVQTAGPLPPAGIFSVVGPKI